MADTPPQPPSAHCTGGYTKSGGPHGTLQTCHCCQGTNHRETGYVCPARTSAA